MKLNILQLANGYKTCLLEDVFPLDLLSQIHVLCEQSEQPNSGWDYSEWTKLRKIYNNEGNTAKDIKNFLASATFVEPLENIIKQKLSLTDFAFWADYPGFGSLLPHTENNGFGQGQIFITKKEFSTNGTSFLNDNKQLLFTLPYRNNFGWYMDQCTKIMHSREFDVPQNTVRYSLIFWHNYR